MRNIKGLGDRFSQIIVFVFLLMAPVIVERIVSDIDNIVKIVRFDGWQNTTAGRQELKKALRIVIWIKYKIKDKDVFDRAYGYIEQYY